MKRVAIFLYALFSAWASLAQEKKEITANEVVERIKKQVGLEWRADTVDTFKGGDPNTKVTGIATTMMATMDVLQRAVVKGDNLIITHEPTYYDHLDTSSQLPQGENDAVLAQNVNSSRNTISLSGDFTITGTCASPTEFFWEW